MRNTIGWFLALFTLALATPGVAFAADCNDVVITSVQASNAQCQAGSLAFNTSNFGVWQCVAKSGATGYSDFLVTTYNQLVLSAFLSGKTVRYDILGVNTCNATNYTTSIQLFYTTI